jgi:hypothetical protein
MFTSNNLRHDCYFPCRFIHSPQLSRAFIPFLNRMRSRLFSTCLNIECRIHAIYNITLATMPVETPTFWLYRSSFFIIINRVCWFCSRTHFILPVLSVLNLRSIIYLIALSLQRRYATEYLAQRLRNLHSSISRSSLYSVTVVISLNFFLNNSPLFFRSVYFACS